MLEAADDDHLEVGGKGKRVWCILDLTCRDTWTTWWTRWGLDEVEEVLLVTDREEGRTHEAVYRGVCP